MPVSILLSSKLYGSLTHTPALAGRSENSSASESCRTLQKPAPLFLDELWKQGCGKATSQCISPGPVALRALLRAFKGDVDFHISDLCKTTRPKPKQTLSLSVWPASQLFTVPPRLVEAPLAPQEPEESKQLGQAGTPPTRLFS